MFVYTVYPVSNTALKQGTRRVDAVSPVGAVRPVTGSWRTQYGNQPQALYGVGHPNTLESAARTSADQVSFQLAAPAQDAMSARVSEMPIHNLSGTVLEHRAYKPVEVEPDFIKKYVQSLNNARDKTLRAVQRATRQQGETRPANPAQASLLEM